MAFSIDTIVNNIIREDFDMINLPANSRKLKYPCSICKNSVMNNQKAIECDSCKLWAHIKCDGTSSDTYRQMMEDVSNSDTPWYCLVCRIRINHNHFPFTLSDNTELNNIVKADSLRMAELFPSFEVLTEISNFSNLNAIDIDSNISTNVNCNYYAVDEFHKLHNNNSFNFSLFHSNVNGLDTHFENLHEFLSGNPIEFDVINITETSQNILGDFKTNISIEGYDPYFTPSNSSKGGTGIYIKNIFDAIERTDLKIMTDDYEATWIEIKNKKSKNIVCGCIYRHPRNDMTKFIEYIENCLETLDKENKQVYISGDFNIDLLKLDNNSAYLEFYNLLVSHGFLPQIINPTRITDTTATVIDNIYTNCFQYSQNSGNILLSISEHFSQFISVKRNKIDFKNLNIYRHNYSKFNTQSFRDDVSLQKWDNDLTDVNDQFNDFYWRLEKCVERHAPLKKLNKKEVKLSSKPWITLEIEKLIKIRNKIFNRKKRQPNNENVKCLYNLFRNRVNRDLKKSKKSYYKTYFEESKNDIKKTWNGIKSLINTAFFNFSPVYYVRMAIKRLITHIKTMI